MITETITSSLKKALEDLEVSDLPSEINLEQPANKDHGDWSSNIALATAKNAGWSPRDLASEIAELINSDLPNGVENVTIAGPGFINFALSPQWLHDVLQTVLDQGTEEFGKVDIVADGDGDTAVWSVEDGGRGAGANAELLALAQGGVDLVVVACDLALRID